MDEYTSYRPLYAMIAKVITEPVKTMFNTSNKGFVGMLFKLALFKMAVHNCNS